MQSNQTHQHMLNRLETISLQESTRKGQSRAHSLIAGSHSRTKPRGASSVAAIGGPLPPKIPPPTSAAGAGNYIPANGIGGSQSHRKQSQQLHHGIQLKLAEPQGLASESGRSKSLVRGSATSRPSGIGTGVGRLTQLNQTAALAQAAGRQRDFEEHVGRFNQLDPLVRG